jgi:hypothetical protein
MLTEQESHDVEHARYQVNRATPDNPDCVFDYELVATLLRIIDRVQETAGDEPGFTAEQLASMMALDKARKDLKPKKWVANEVSFVTVPPDPNCQIGRLDRGQTAKIDIVNQGGRRDA